MAINKQDLEAFYEKYEASLYNFALRWTWNPALAEELIQDALIRIWEKRDHVELTTLKGLTYKALQNIAINELRRRSWLEKLPFISWYHDRSTRDLEHEFIKREDLGRLKEAIESLPLELKEVLLLTEFSDMSYTEIGTLLNIPSGTVGSRRNRALGILQETLKEKTNEI